jgi:sRNA-binding protein
MGPRLALALAMLTAGLAACGPLAYVNEVTRRADDAVAEARSADAEKYAPYWWTRATQYLHKARENAARADFEGANRFGRLATEAAQRALVEAKDPSRRQIDPDPVEAEPRPAPKPAAGAAPAKGTS